MESDSASSLKGLQRETDGNFKNSVVEISNMLSGSNQNGIVQADFNTIYRDCTRPIKRKSIMTKEDSEIKLMLDNPFTVKKNKSYSHAQNRFIKRRTEKCMNNYNITPIEIYNFLKNGRNKYKWATATIFSYRAAILSLCRDYNIIISNSVFKQYFEELNRSTIKSFDYPAYDISPITECLINWGENNSLTPEQLTQKLCWLLAICGFMRPSDIERIDDKRTIDNEEFVRFVVISPKEKRSGSSIEKEYKKRVAVLSCEGFHPINSSLTIGYLVRSLNNFKKKIGGQRISKHMNYLMKLISIDMGSKVPKARALGSTIATTAGATYDDVISQGFWSSRGIFDDYYQLSRRSRNNLTNLVLGNVNSEAT
ncbi:hypothetical protein BB561_004614 [Smittium simulii]|uniref:Tyr recombinase domain-containing protein n=1 Tax=Smittium simulii TaxID=133385 RepID=A0A2T9YF62_9FUNG|nr:hypothetical protein BB561_004614 [Smittium simulii]